MKKISIKILFMATIISLLVFSCSKKKNKLYVGTNAEFAPFEYREKNEIVGFDIDLIREISKLIGKDVEIVDMAFDGLLPALQSKKIDLIIAGMTADEEREKFVNFSTPYYNSKQAIIVGEDNTDITSFEDLKGKNIGVVIGFTGDLIASDIEDANVTKFNSSSDVIIALQSKKIDAFILDFEPAKNYVKNNSGIKLVESDFANEEYAIALRKEDKELLDEINKALQTLNDNGTYNNLIEKYFN